MTRWGTALVGAALLAGCSSGPDQAQAQENYYVAMEAMGVKDHANADKLQKAVCGIRDAQERAAFVRAVKAGVVDGATYLPVIVKWGIPAGCPDKAGIWLGADVG